VERFLAPHGSARDSVRSTWGATGDVSGLFVRPLLRKITPTAWVDASPKKKEAAFVVTNID
jgi:hypothetical protein